MKEEVKKKKRKKKKEKEISRDTLLYRLDEVVFIFLFPCFSHVFGNIYIDIHFYVFFNFF